MGPVSHWDLLCVVTFGHSECEVVISCPLQAPPSTMLDDKLLILDVQAYWYTVLRLHNFTSNCVLVVVHWFMDSHVGCLEHSGLSGYCLLPFFLLELSFDFIKNL